MTSALVSDLGGPAGDPADATAAGVKRAGPAFRLPPELEASEPPEARGLKRDAVRMLVASKASGTLVHASFFELPSLLEEGDLVVINTSGTLAAAVTGVDQAGRRLDVHLSGRLPAGLWMVELRVGGRPHFTATAGDAIDLPGGGRVTLLAPHALHRQGVRLWVAVADVPGSVPAYVAIHGRPITYGYARGEWPLSAYQNVYVTEAGSAEMPSAGRPFSLEVITRLVARGIGVTPLLLHTGVASLESGELPYPEYFKVPTATAHRVNAARRDGGRVIAVGTTVVRALETVVDRSGKVHPGNGWTDMIVTPARRVRSVDGLLTGWHEPEASHLAMLEAIAGPKLLERSYTVALEEGYLWHEFGDVHLVLP
jgi:S-adenosylmethionine:tRNA ribosyltransferase-isomerase